MLLNHARAFNSGVPVQLVYDATGSITDVALQLIGFGFTSFHTHMNLECLCFIPTDMELEESYTTVWTGKQSSHVKNKDNYEEWYDLVMAVLRCPFENVRMTL